MLELAAEVGGGHGGPGGSGIEVLVEDARMAEDLGFGAVLIPDHYVFEVLGELQPERPAYDLFVVLATLAHLTSRVKLVSHVACVLFRHPAMHARLFAQIDEASGGRVIAGIGAGWTRAEFEMMGLDYPPVSERLEILDETAEIMRGLWTQDRYSFEGRHFRLTDAVCTPKPAQVGGPALMVGGSGKGILRRAGRWADIIHMAPVVGGPGTTTMEEVAKFSDAALPGKLAVVREAEAAAGRPAGSVRLATTAFVSMLTSTEREAREAAEPLAAMVGLDVEQVMRHPAVLLGTVEQVVDELQRRRDEHGMGMIGINAGDEAQLRAFGEKVIPRL